MRPDAFLSGRGGFRGRKGGEEKDFVEENNT